MPLYVLVPVYATTADENIHSMKKEKEAILLTVKGKGKTTTLTNNFKGGHRYNSYCFTNVCFQKQQF